MKCPRCRTIHTEPAKECRRCATALPQPRCKQCKATVDWGRSWCDRHQPEELRQVEVCPACGVENDPEADYCIDCGSPMAVITRVIDTADGDDHPDPWRVYGVETNLIGRDDELEQLQQTLHQVESSSTCRVGFIAGNQGLGKSRLLAEFERLLESSFSETAILRGGCRREVGGAFSVITRMLRSRFYIPDDDDASNARRRLFQAVDALVDERSEEITASVARLMGLAAEEGQTETTGQASPDQMEQASFQALAQLLAADARRNPLLLIFDDFHHATDATRRLLAHLVEELDSSPIFFLFAVDEPEPQAVGLPRGIADLKLELAPLSDTEVRRQVADTLRLAEDIPEVLVEKIVDAALGNPMAVEEMLRIFISENVIDTRSDPWQIDTDGIDDIDLPTTVEETVKARLRGLTDAEHRALQMGACVGTLFWDDLLRCLDRLRRNNESRPDQPWMQAHLPPAIDAVVESLERKDMIRRRSDSRVAGHREFVFKHRLERQALYDGLATRQRKRYHRLIAQWLQRRIDDDDAAEFIARHYANAACLRRAARHYLRAADHAAAHHANREAIDLYLEALSCLTDADLDLKMRACHDLGSVYALLGEHRQANTYFRDMARYAWLSGRNSKLGAALNKLGRALRELGRYDEALDHFDRALEHFRNADDERGVASTLDDIGKIHWVRGDQDQALEYYRASLQMRRNLEDDRSIALSLSHIGSLKLTIGDIQEATKYLHEAMQLRKQIDDPLGLAGSYNDFGVLCIERDNYEKALPVFEKALELARKVGVRSLECAILNNLGETQMELKRRDEARDYLNRARELAADIGHRRVMFDVERNLAHLAVSDAERELALQRIDRALELARELDSRSYIAIAELTRAEIHAEYVFDPELKDESIDKATAAFRRAISLLDETNVDIQLARALSSFGHFLIERGDYHQAATHLQRAAELFDRLQMDDAREEAEQLLAAAEA